MENTTDTWFCPDCGVEVQNPRQRGPHLSGCRRKANAKYHYMDGDNKHPYEYKACATCGEKSWIQVRRDHCSYSCSKMGDKNPSKQKTSGHTLSKTEYVKAHCVVRNTRGDAFGCMHCGTVEDRMYHWANISGDYWNVEDYISLCVPCHDRFDRRKGRTRGDDADTPPGRASLR